MLVPPQSSRTTSEGDETRTLGRHSAELLHPSEQEGAGDDNVQPHRARAHPKQDGEMILVFAKLDCHVCRSAAAAE